MTASTSTTVTSTVLSVDEPAAAAYAEARGAQPRRYRGGARAELVAGRHQVRRDIVTTIQGPSSATSGETCRSPTSWSPPTGTRSTVDPTEPDAPGRDRFVLSKGHCAAALYSTLASVRLLPRAELATFAKPLSPLNGHPNRVKVPGVETNTGPLGHGLPVAAGLRARRARLRGAGLPHIVVMGDGEMQEGSNWEAAMTAAHCELHNLTAIVDRNRLQQGARTEDTKTLEPLHDKWASFGWETRRIDGHDHLALLEAMGPSTTGKPVAIVADTIKGKGVSFMEDRVEWHHKVPTDEQVRAALEELSA